MGFRKVIGCRFILFVLSVLTVNFSRAQTITSASGGDWNNNATWVGGAVPTSVNDVVIAAGHVVDVNNAQPECKNLNFGSATSKLNMASAGSVLDIYGNFTAFDNSHTVFSGWTTGAKVRFTGTTPVQTISGYPANAAPNFSFMELEIDKASGKVTTDGSGMRLGIGTSFSITNGTFELGVNDDIEGRGLTGTGSTKPDFTINAGDSLLMTSVNSHIRSGNLSTDDGSKIGQMTVYGYVYLIPNQSNRINVSNIVIKGGGEVEVAGGGTNTNMFNPGTITVEADAVFRSTKESNYWYNNITTSTSLTIQSGGELDFNGVTNANNLPAILNINAGSYVRYSKPAQTLSSDSRLTSYYNLVLVGTAKTLSQNIAVTDSLFMRTSVSPIEAPSLNLATFTLTYGGNATLVYRGIGSAPAAQTTANTEWPGSGSRPANVQIYNKSDVTLNETKAITGRLSFRGGTGENARLKLGAYNLSADSCFNYSSTRYVMTNGSGKLTLTGIGAVPKVLAIGNSTFNPLTISNGSNHNWSANVEDNLVVTQTPFDLNAPYAVQRTWNITPSVNPPASGADIVFQYNQVTDVIPGNFNTTEPVQVFHKETTFNYYWLAVGVTQVPGVLTGDDRTATISNWSNYSPFAISTFGRPLPSGFLSFSGSKKANYNFLKWIIANADISANYEVQRSADGINYMVIATVSGHSFVDGGSDQLRYEYKDPMPPGTRQMYRIKMVSRTGEEKFTNVIVINQNGHNPLQLTVAPNPARDIVHALLYVPAEMQVQFSIIDLTGKNVIQKNVHVTEGTNNIGMDVSHLASGTYMLVVVMDNTARQSVIFIKN